MKITRMMRVVGVMITAWLVVVPGYAASVEVEASEDGYVRHTSDDDGVGTQIMLQEYVTGNNYAKGYLKFDVSSLSGMMATNATLSLVYSQRNTLGTYTIGVYGITSTNWTESTIDRDTVPSNNHPSNEFSPAVFLGSFDFDSNASVSTYGDVFTLSSEALTDFLNTVTNDHVTIGVNIQVNSGVQNGSIWFATHENTTYDAPKLSMDLVPAVKSTIITHQDAYIYESNPAGNYGTNATLEVQDAAYNGRKVYIKFAVPSSDVLDAKLSLIIDSDNVMGGEPPSTTGMIGVYGINDSANLDSWAEIGVRYYTAPANDTNSNANGFTSDATWLGDIDIHNAMNGGYELVFSGQSLIDFLNEDTDGAVTIALNMHIDEGTPNMMIYLASRENTTYDAPKLVVFSDSRSLQIGNIAYEMIGSGENMIVSWAGRSGVSYALQRADDLLSGVWTNVQAGISGPEGTLCATNLVDGAQAFFRVTTE